MLTFYELFNDNNKKLKAKLFKPFFFKYCWTNCTFKWGRKNYLLAPLFKFTSFKTVAANLCIIWSESNDILTKKWKKYKKLNPSLQFWMQTKILEVTHALPKYTVVLSLHILLVWADLHVSWFSGDYPLCSFSC